MEYHAHAKPAAYALPETRAGFVRRTCAHLAFAVLALEYVLLNLPGIERLAALMTGGFRCSGCSSWCPTAKVD